MLVVGKNENPEQVIQKCDTCSELQITFGDSQIIQTQDSIIIQVGGNSSITMCSLSQ